VLVLGGLCWYDIEQSLSRYQGSGPLRPELNRRPTSTATKRFLKKRLRRATYFMTFLAASESYQIFRGRLFLWKFDERCWDGEYEYGGTSARVPPQCPRVSINFSQQVALGRTAHRNPVADFMIPASLPQQEHYLPNSSPCVTCPAIGASQAHPGAGCPSADCCIANSFMRVAPDWLTDIISNSSSPTPQSKCEKQKQDKTKDEKKKKKKRRTRGGAKADAEQDRRSSPSSTNIGLAYGWVK